MFSKLLKYEWKSSAHVLGVLSFVALGIGVFATIVLRILVSYGDAIVESDSPLVLVLVMMVMMLVFSFVGLALYVAAVQIILLVRFYKNKFTDEGYLTFTLPVNTHQIFLSSIVNMLIWMVIAIALVVSIIFLVILFGTGGDQLVNMEAIKALGQVGDVFKELFLDLYGDGYSVLNALIVVITPVASIILAMTCITLGAVVTKKLKILAAIGFYYAANAAISVISSTVMMIPMITMLNSGNLESYYTVMSVFQIVMYTAITVGGYFLSTGLMKNKLNLS